MAVNDAFTRAAKTQAARKRHLTHYCRTHSKNPELPDKQQLGQLLVDDDENYIFCSVPKVASTTIKGILLSLRNDSDKIEKFSVHTPSLWQHMSQFNRTENSKRLMTHFKFLFVREPFHRLLSAYKDKFWGSNRIYTNGFRRIIVQEFRPQDIETISTTANNVTFNEFLRYILTYPDSFISRDDHWKQYGNLCFPCVIQFDFIGHYETLDDDDATYLLKLAGIDDRVVFPPIHSSRADDDFLKFYSQVPHQLIFRIGEIFKKDFEMFGYSFPGPLKELLTNYTMNTNSDSRKHE